MNTNQLNFYGKLENLNVIDDIIELLKKDLIDLAISDLLY